MKDEAKNVAAVTADYAVKDALGVEERREPRFVKVGRTARCLTSFPTAANVCWPRSIRWGSRRMCSWTRACGAM